MTEPSLPADALKLVERFRAGDQRAADELFRLYVNRLTALAYRVNHWADSLFTNRIGTRAEYGIVNAMLLGVRDDLDQSQYDTYAAAGAVHILSVSGLHVGILFIVVL